ncbi:MAG: hypothetical protein ACR2RA_09460 [Geminicoccaceae bacterium]
MDINAAFYAGEGLRTVLVTIENLGPYLILALSLLLFWNRRQLNRYEDQDDDRLDGRTDRGLAKDLIRYEHDLVDENSDGGRGLHPLKTGKVGKVQTKKRRFLLRRSSHLVSLLGLIVSTAGIGLALLPLLHPTIPQRSAPPVAYQPAPPKGLEVERFKAKVIAASQHRASGDIELAMRTNLEAMTFPNVPITDNAEPMVNIAEMLIEQGLYERAYMLASIAAELRSDDPDFINTFAQVLIETCELDDAVDWLEGLEDERSLQLLERVDIRRPDCSEG